MRQPIYRGGSREKWPDQGFSSNIHSSLMGDIEVQRERIHLRSKKVFSLKEKRGVCFPIARTHPRGRSNEGGKVSTS